MKKGLALVVSIVILGGSLVNGVVMTYANNHTDTRFSFYYYGDGSDTAIPPRSKQDNTASYMKNNATSPTLAVCVAGTNSLSSYSGLEPNYCSGPMEVPSGSYRYIPNSVYGQYRYAYLTMGCDDKMEHTISGKWSPDNISGRY